MDITLIPLVESQDQKKLVIDLTQEHLKGNSWWNNFLEDANREGRYLRAGGEFVDLTLHLEFYFDSETLIGSIGGSRKDTTGLVRFEDSLTGSIKGWVRKKNWYGFWGWEFSANVSLTLNFKLEQKITNETGTYWEGRADTINVVADLIGDTYAGEDSIGVLQINWQDEERGLYVSCLEVNERGACVLPGEFPKPWDIEISIDGPDKVDSVTSEAVFELVTSGRDIEMVKHVQWYFYYYDGDYGDYWHFETIQKDDPSNLEVFKEKLDEWLNYVEQYGVIKEGVKTLDVKVEVLVFTEDMIQLLGPVEHFFEFSSSTKMKCRITGVGLPMKNMEVLYIDDENTITNSTDTEGYYKLPDKREESYIIQLFFKYVSNNVCYFTINQSPSIIWIIEFEVEKDKIKSVYFYDADKKIPLSKDLFSIPIDEIKLEDFLNKDNGGEALIYIYHHTTEALEFYKNELGEDMTYLLPLPIYPYQKGPSIFSLTGGAAPRLYYFIEGNKHGIEIQDHFTSETTELRPKSREYHEFSHYAMKSIYKKFPREGQETRINHAGYINPSTADSYVEAFAYFMSQIIGELYYSRWPGKIGAPDWIPGKGSMEYNWQAFDNMGRAEEYAVAGVLWDLYDGEEQIKKRIESTKSAYTEEYSEIIKNYDIDGDGILDRVEQIWKDLVDSNLKRVSDDLLVHDENEDFSFDLTELSNALEEKEEAKTILEKYDADKNLILSPSEVGLFILDEFKKKAFEVNDEIDKYPLYRNFPLQISLNDYMYELNKLTDDDGISLSFKDIWSILRTYKDDFTSVYEELKGKYPEKLDDINAVFISHGFWVDLNAGNGIRGEAEPFLDENKNGRFDEGEFFVDYPEGGFVYNTGEEIGRTTNYQRKERRSGGYFPGHYLEIDNEVPYYQIKYSIYDDSFFAGLLPYQITYDKTSNLGGYVYVPIPPDSYNATIKVEPLDVDYSRPLSFTNREFYDTYTKSVEQGFFLVHDFGITGDIPSPPTDFLEWLEANSDTITETSTPEPESSQEVETESDDKSKPGIPGFPIESIIVGLFLLVFISHWLGARAQANFRLKR